MGSFCSLHLVYAFVCLFAYLAALGLCRGLQAFSSCSSQGFSLAVVRRFLLLWSMGSRACGLQELHCAGLGAL